MSPDYSKFQPVPADDRMARLDAMSDALLSANREVARLEAELKAAKKRVTELEEGALPELLAELNTKDITTGRGIRIQVKQEVHASLPKDWKEREIAIKWLEDNGHGALAKTHFVITFPRGKQGEKDAKQAYDQLLALDLPVPITKTVDVHHSTLAAFCREQLREGREIPLETLGGHTRTVAVVETK